MPLTAATATDREAESGLMGPPSSDSDDENHAPVVRTATSIVRESRAKQVVGVMMLSFVLAGAAVLGGLPNHGPGGGALPADMERLIGESHYTSSCSFKCNSDFWGKTGAKSNEDSQAYSTCCQGCPGSVCTTPCTDSCEQKQAKMIKKCSDDAATCESAATGEHGQCCSKCPGGVCITPPAGGDPAAVAAYFATLLTMDPSASDSAADDAPPEAADASADAAQETCGGTGAGAPCVFPFTYQGQSNTKCTSAGSPTNEEWCYTQACGEGADCTWGSCNCAEAAAST